MLIAGVDKYVVHMIPKGPCHIYIYICVYIYICIPSLKLTEIEHVELETAIWLVNVEKILVGWIVDPP